MVFVEGKGVGTISDSVELRGGEVGRRSIISARPAREWARSEWKANFIRTSPPESSCRFTKSIVEDTFHPCRSFASRSTTSATAQAVSLQAQRLFWLRLNHAGHVAPQLSRIAAWRHRTGPLADPLRRSCRPHAPVWLGGLPRAAQRHAGEKVAAA